MGTKYSVRCFILFRLIGYKIKSLFYINFRYLRMIDIMDPSFRSVSCSSFLLLFWQNRSFVSSPRNPHTVVEDVILQPQAVHKLHLLPSPRQALSTIWTHMCFPSARLAFILSVVVRMAQKHKQMKKSQVLVRALVVSDKSVDTYLLLARDHHNNLCKVSMRHIHVITNSLLPRKSL